ncbi:energy transducer TonB [Dokdonella sp.]|nr:energy transducer TonB [Dokdonella sp.]
MYPRTAVRERLEGNVVLRVRVAADGSVLGASILKASAHSVLDEAAVQYVRASHFPVYTPPGSSAPACYLVRVPIAFRFEGSVDKS